MDNETSETLIPKPAPHRATIMMEVEEWVFSEPASVFEEKISDEVAAISAELKDFFMQKYLARRNGNV